MFEAMIVGHLRSITRALIEKESMRNRLADNQPAASSSETIGEAPPACFDSSFPHAADESCLNWLVLSKVATADDANCAPFELIATVYQTDDSEKLVIKLIDSLNIPQPNPHEFLNFVEVSNHSRREAVNQLMHLSDDVKSGVKKVVESKL